MTKRQTHGIRQRRQRCASILTGVADVRDNDMLTPAEQPVIDREREGSRVTARHALWALIGISTILRLVWAASQGAAFDEPYYFQYIQHPALSYFDHPPMVALVGASGLALTGDAFSVFGLRVGFIVLFAGSTWLMARLTARFYGPTAGVLAALALSASGYFGMAVATIAQPDGPLLFFWLLTLDRLAVALDDPDRLVPWLGVGAGLGRGDAEQVPRRPPAGRGVASHGLLAPGPSLSAKTGALPRGGDRIDPVRAGDRLERDPRLGLVPVPGWSRVGLASAPARSTRRGLGRRGTLPVPVALDRNGRITRQAHPAWASRLGQE